MIAQKENKTITANAMVVKYCAKVHQVVRGLRCKNAPLLAECKRLRIFSEHTWNDLHGEETFIEGLVSSISREIRAKAMLLYEVRCELASPIILFGRS